VGTQSVILRFQIADFRLQIADCGFQIADCRLQISDFRLAVADFELKLQVADFCREIESYLCQKNDGHLIRVTGPSFDLVAGWAERGVPIKVAFQGIDRYFERYYRKGPRRRPVKIDFCEADVLDAFDEWRRATGIGAFDLRASLRESPDGDPGAATASTDSDAPPQNLEPRRPNSWSRHPSLPEHLKRVLLRLTSARAAGSLDASFDALLDGVSNELDHAQGRRLRGASRQAMIERLELLDREFLQKARALLDEEAATALSVEADEALAPFRAGMSADARARAREAAIDRLVRERFNLPIIALSGGEIED
jgi:hypothetical protein